MPGIDSGSGAGMTGWGRWVPAFGDPCVTPAVRSSFDFPQGEREAQAQVMAWSSCAGMTGGWDGVAGWVWGAVRAKDFSPLRGWGGRVGALGARFRRPLRNPGCPFVLRFPSGRTGSPGAGYGMVFVRGDDGGMGRSGGVGVGCGEGERFFAPTRLGRPGWGRWVPAFGDPCVTPAVRAPFDFPQDERTAQAQVMAWSSCAGMTGGWDGVAGWVWGAVRAKGFSPLHGWGGRVGGAGCSLSETLA